MTLLNNLFDGSGNAGIAEEEIFKKWAQYVETLRGKTAILEKLPYSFGERNALLNNLKAFLDSELVDIHAMEQKDKEVISDIVSWKHEDRMRRIKRLDDYLAFVETKHEYMDELLRNLYACLVLEVSLWKQFSKVTDIREYRKCTEALAAECVIEKQIVHQLSSVRDFSKFLAAVVRAEKTVHRITASEKKIIREMKQSMRSIFSGAITEGMLADWALSVFNEIQDQVEDSSLDEQEHTNFDFQLVNDPSFIELVRRKLVGVTNYYESVAEPDALRRASEAKNVSEEMIRAFVHLFREWYNHEREEILV